jgi:ferritin-like metal-binding protein YciE
MHDAVGLLEETLQEEKKTDQLLTQLAEAVLNQKAA